MPCVASLCSSTARSPAGRTKLGQPEPLSNLSPLSNSGCPHPAQTYSPAVLFFSYLPVNARSVPAWRRIRVLLGRQLLAPLGIGEDGLVGHHDLLLAEIWEADSSQERQRRAADIRQEPSATSHAFTSA
jgi:hypothetical protein